MWCTRLCVRLFDEWIAFSGLQFVRILSGFLSSILSLPVEPIFFFFQLFIWLRILMRRKEVTHTQTQIVYVYPELKSMHHLMLTFIWMYVIKHFDKNWSVFVN